MPTTINSSTGDLQDLKNSANSYKETENSNTENVSYEISYNQNLVPEEKKNELLVDGPISFSNDQASITGIPLNTEVTITRKNTIIGDSQEGEDKSYTFTSGKWKKVIQNRKTDLCYTDCGKCPFGVYCLLSTAGHINGKAVNFKDIKAEAGVGVSELLSTYVSQDSEILNYDTSQEIFKNKKSIRISFTNIPETVSHWSLYRYDKFKNKLIIESFSNLNNVDIENINAGGTYAIQVEYPETRPSDYNQYNNFEMMEINSTASILTICESLNFKVSITQIN